MDTSEVLIGMPEGDHVLLLNWRKATGEWVSADAELRCGPWHGRIKVEFFSNELPRFGEEIRKLYSELRGTAILDPIEPYLKLRLTGNGRGEVVVNGVAQSLFGIDTQLSFHFVIDQTFLPRIADCLCAHGAR